MNEDRDNLPSSSEQQPYPAAPPERDQASYSDAYYTAPQEGRTPYGYNPDRYYAKEDAAAHRGQIGLRAILALSIICVLVAGALAIGGMYLLFRGRPNGADAAGQAVDFYAEARQAQAPKDTEPPLRISAPEEAVPTTGEALYAAACGQVVGIQSSRGAAGQTVRESGSGIVVTSDGYILTNYHVIRPGLGGGGSITVVTYDGDSYTAQVAGTEADSDLAVLKIDAGELPAASLGDSDSLSVGGTVYTVGNPLGDLPYTMTRGIVSALDRRITTEENVVMNMFQFDAAVSRGNSGGPVYNAYGQVVGIVTAKSSAAGVEGLGFAIPICDACSIANELITRGYVPGKAYLGLTLKTITPAAAQYFRLVPGAYVHSVVPGSAADAAGLAPGDIITAVDGAAVSGEDDLRTVLRDYQAGDSAELTVLREQEYITVSVIFDEAVPDGVSGENTAP